MRPQGPNRESFERLRRETAQAVQNFIEAELSVLDTFFEVARDSYLRGNRRAGDHAKAEGMIGVQTVRLFMWTSELLSRAFKVSATRRLDELERRLMMLQRKNPVPT